RTAPAGPSRTHPKNAPASSTPAADGERVYAIFWDGRDVTLHAYDFKGKPAWQCKLGTYVQSREKNRHGCACSPVVHGGKVFATSGDGSGARDMIAVKLGGKGDVTRTALAWEKPRSTPYVPTVLAHNGHVYAVNDDSTAFCVDGKTGTERWRRRLGAAQVSA